MNGDIAIVGYWTRTNGCEDNEEFKQNFFSAKDNSTAIANSPMKWKEATQTHPNLRCGFIERKGMFDNKYFGITDAEALSMDPQQRISLQGLIHALEQTGLPASSISDIAPAIFCSSWSNEYRDLFSDTNQYHLTGNMGSIIAGRVAHFLNSRGVSMSVESACSSSLIAIQQAVNTMILGQTKMAIVIAANSIGERTTREIYSNRMLAPDGFLKSFDCDANGYSRSEGFAIIILSTESLAHEYNLNIYGLITKVVSNSDGRSKTLLSPSLRAQTDNLKHLLHNSAPTSADLIVAHGTGTKIGDATECRSIKSTFGNEVVVSSPKSTMGHSEACSGITSIIFGLIAMNRDYLSPQLHLRIPVEDLRCKRTTFVGEEFVPTRVIVNSFGLGGTNVSLLMKKFTQPKSAKHRRNLDIIFLSAKSAKSLDLIQQSWSKFIESSSSKWNDILYTNQARTDFHDIRRCFRAKNRHHFLESLRGNGHAVTIDRVNFTNNVPRIGFLWMEKFNLPFAQFLDETLLTIENLHIHDMEECEAFNTFLLSASWIRLAETLGFSINRVSGAGVGLLTAMYWAGCLTINEAINLIVAYRHGTWLSELKATKLKNPLKMIESSDGGKFDISMLDDLKFEGNETSIQGFGPNGNIIDLISKEGIEVMVCDLFISQTSHKLEARGQHVSLPKYVFEEEYFWPHSINHIESFNNYANNVEEEIPQNLKKVFLECGYFHDLDSPIEWISFDSLHLTELKETLQKKFKLQLSHEDLVKFNSLTDLSDFVIRNLRKNSGKVSAKKTNTKVNFGVVSIEMLLPNDMTDLTTVTDYLLTGCATVSPKRLVNEWTEICSEFQLTSDELKCMNYTFRNLFNCLVRLKRSKKEYDFHGSPLVFAMSGYSHRNMNLNDVKLRDDRITLGNVPSIAAGRAAAYLGCTGNIFVVEHTCCSVHNAIQICKDYMVNHDARYGIVMTSQPGTEPNCENITKSFDMDRDAYSKSEAVGIIILTSHAHENDSLITIEQQQNEFAGNVFTPSIHGYSAMLESMKNVDYIECHGTSTLVGDSFEGESLMKSGFKGIIGSVKSSLGHSETASGLCQLLHVLSMSNSQIVSQQLHLKLPEENLRKNERITLPFINEERHLQNIGAVCYGLNGSMSSIQFKTVNSLETVETKASTVKTCSHESIYHKMMDCDSSRFFGYFFKNSEELYLYFKKSIDGAASNRIASNSLSFAKLDISDTICFLDFYVSNFSFKQKVDGLFAKLTNVPTQYIFPIAFSCAVVEYLIYQNICLVHHTTGVAILGFSLYYELLTITEVNDFFLHFSIEHYSILMQQIAERVPSENSWLHTLLSHSFLESSQHEIFLKTSGSKILNYAQFVAVVANAHSKRRMNSIVLQTARNLEIETSENATNTIGEIDVEVKVFQNHNINGMSIVSGSYLLFQLTQRQRLTGVVFMSLLKCSSNPLKISIDSNRILHQKSEIMIFKQQSQLVTFPQRLDIQPTSRKSYSMDHIYTLFHNSAYQYENDFKCLSRVVVSNESSGIFKVKALEQSFLALEACLQAPVFHYLMTHQTVCPLYPYSISEIVFYKCFGKDAHGEYTIKSFDNYLSADIVLLDENDKCVLSITDAVFIKEHTNTNTESPMNENGFVAETSTILDSIENWITEQLGITDIDSDKGFFENGLNSLHLSYLTEFLTKTYAFLRLTDLFDYGSPRKLANFLLSKQNIALETNAVNTMKNEIPCTNAISITGFSCRLPGSVSDSNELWDMIKSGRNCNISIPQSRIETRHNLVLGKKYGKVVEGGYFCDNIDMFDNAYFNLSKSEAELIDPQQKLILECAFECLQNCNISSTDGIGVFIGLMGTEYSNLMKNRTDVLSMLSSATSFLSGRLNYMLNSKGPSQTIDTACSSSLVALDSAMKALRNGECSTALVGGVNLIVNENGLGQRANGGMLSENGICKTFDATASGYGRADGCVMLMLENRKGRINVKNVHTNHCGRGTSLTSPNGISQKELLSAVIGTNNIKFWEAHGTGTNLGDPIEVNVLSNILSYATISSGKASYGHSEAAAGVTALLKSSLQMDNNYMPPLLHFSCLNTNIHVKNLNVPIVGYEAEIDLCGISSFGISGTNAACLLHKIKRNTSCGHVNYPFQICPVSAKSAEALVFFKQNVMKVIQESDECSYCIASTAASKVHHDHKSFIVIKEGRDVASEVYQNDICVSNISFDVLFFPKLRKYFLEQKEHYTINVALAIAVFKFFKDVTSNSLRFKTNNADICIAYSVFRQFIDSRSAEILADSSVNQILNWVKCNCPSTCYDILHGVVEWKSQKLVNFRTLCDYIGCGFVKGEKINWNVIYDINHTTPVMLPNHAYFKQRLWCEELFDYTTDCFLGQKEVRDANHIIFKNRVNVKRFPHLLEMSNAAIIFDIGHRVAQDLKRTIYAIHISELEENNGVRDGSIMKIVWNSKDCNFILYFDGRKFASVSILRNFNANIPLKLQFGKNPISLDVKYSHAKVSEKTPSCFEVETLSKDRIICTIVDLLERSGYEVGAILISDCLPNTINLELGPEIQMMNQNTRIGVVHVAKRNSKIIVESTTSPSSASLESPEVKNIQQQLFKILTDVSTKTIHFDSHFSIANAGLDSLGIVDFVNRVNISLQESIMTTTDVFEYQTIDCLSNVLRSRILEVKSSIGSNTKSSNNTVISEEKDWSNENFLKISERSSADSTISEENLDNPFIYSIKIPNIFREHYWDVKAKYDPNIGYFELSSPNGRISANSQHLDLFFSTFSTGSSVQMLVMSEHSLNHIYKLTEAVIQLVRSASGFGLHFRVSIPKHPSDSFYCLSAAFKTVSSERFPEFQLTWEERLVPSPIIRNGYCTREYCGLSWMITGGLSGIGWVLAKHVAYNYKAETIVLVSRRNMTSEKKREVEKIERTTGCKVITVSCDITNLDSFVLRMKSVKIKIGAVIHSAGVISDALIDNQNSNSLRSVFLPKVVGMENIEQLEKMFNWKLKTLIAMSSVAAVLGNKGQLNYSISNAVMDYLILNRRLRGRCGISINWGNWLETGMALGVNSVLRKQGFIGLSTAQALRCFDYALHTTQRQLVVANIDWKTVLRVRPDIPHDIVTVETGGIQTLPLVAEVDTNNKFPDKHNFDKESEHRPSTTCSSPIIIEPSIKVEEQSILMDNLIRTEVKYMSKGKTTFMFGGQGTQYSYLGLQLMKVYPIFNYYFERLLQKAKELMECDCNLLDVLLTNHENLYSTKYGQILVFCFGIASFELWKWLGVKCDYVIGHSVGEITAFAASGILTYDDALRIVVARGKLIEQMKGKGAMFVTSPKAWNTIQNVPGVYLAAENSLKQISVSCSNSAVFRLLEKLRTLKLPVKLINENYPFHSPLLSRKAICKFENAIQNISMHPPSIRVYSAMTCSLIESISPCYFVSQAVSPVYFRHAIDYLMNEGVKRWIDAGPNNILQNFVFQTLPNSSQHTMVSTTKPGCCELKFFITNAKCLLSNVYGLFLNDAAKKQTHLNFNSDIDLISQHHVDNENIVPGTYMLFKLYHLIQLNENENTLILKNITFLRKWNAIYRTVLLNVSDATVDIISSLGAVFQCKYSVGPASISNTTFHTFTTYTNINVNQFYIDMKAMNLEYGERYRCLGKVKIHERKVKATVCIPVAETAREAIVLEGAMHALLAWVWNARKHVYCIPIAINHILFCKCDRIDFSQVSVEGEVLTNNEKFIEANIVIFIAGQLFCKIDKLAAAVQFHKTNHCVIDIENNSKYTKKPEKSVDSLSIYGYSGIFNGSAEDKHFLWDSLISGHTYSNVQRSGIDLCKLIKRDIECFDPESFNVTPTEAKYIDPHLRLLFECVLRAIEDSGIAELPSNTGVFIGASVSEFSQLVLLKQKEHDAHFALGTHPSSLSGRISHWLKLTGPSMVIDTACSSSMVAMATAADHIKMNACEYAIVCGVNVILHDKNTNVLIKNKMLAPNGICKAFDDAADGYVRGEAAVCVILGKQQLHLPSLCCWATRHTGQSIAVTAPKSSAQSELMNLVGCEDVDMVECHMTGTALGDPIEENAVMITVGDAHLCGIKSILGHCEAVAGLVSIVSSLEIMKHQYLPPQMHLSIPNRRFSKFPKLKFIGCDLDIEKILVNSFGFTGTNSCLTLRRPMSTQTNTKTKSSKKYFYLRITASSSSHLSEYISQMKEFINSSSFSLTELECALSNRVRLKNICYLCYSYKRRFVGVQSQLPSKSTTESSIFEQFLDNSENGNFAANLPIKNSNYKNNLRIPGIPLLQTKYWPFDDEVVSENGRQIVYKRKLVLNDCLLFKETFYNHIHNIESYKSPIHTLGQNFHIVFPPISSIKNKFIEIVINLAKLFKFINGGGGYCVLSKENDQTSNLELIAILRTLASEFSNVDYKLIVFETEQQLSQELNDASRNELIVYHQNRRYVERLIVHNFKSGEKRTFETILITGGFGGLGNMIRQLYNPQKVYVISRSSPQNIPPNVIWINADVSIKEELAIELSRITHVDAIFHFSGSVRNKLSHKLSEQDFIDVINPKVNGLSNLLDLTKHLHPQLFMCLSSLSAIFGSAGQLNYCIANALMTWVAESSKRNIQVLHLGPVEDVGMLSSAQLQNIRKMIRDNGWNFLRSQEISNILNSSTENELVVFSGDFERIISKQPHLSKYFTELNLNSIPSEAPLKLSSRSVPPTNPQSVASLIHLINSVSGISSLESKMDVGLMAMGMDSLMIEDLRQKIENNYHIEIAASEIYDHANVTSLWTLITEKVSGNLHLVPENCLKQPFPLKRTNDEIAIVGYSLTASGALTANHFWKNLMNGTESITIESSDIPNFVKASGLLPESKCFDYIFWEIPKEEAISMDPQLRVFLEQTYKALEHSGLIKDLKHFKFGVYAGSEPSEYNKNNNDAKGGLMNMFRSNMKDFLAMWTAHHLNIQGPAVGIYTACSTFMVAMQQACYAIQQEEIDFAIVGSSSIALPDDFEYEYEEGMVLSLDGHCRPFDHVAKGTVRGSAVGAVILSKASCAITHKCHIHGIIRSIGISNDGKQKASFMAPNSYGQQKCIQEASKKLSNSELRKISYIECHGTGTKVGDAVELKALSKSYKHHLKIGSSKANVGHGYASSGLVSTIKLLKIMKHQELPPQINFEKFSDHSNDERFSINRRSEVLPPYSLLAASSFGIGGTNVHLILKPSDALEPTEFVSDFPVLLPISGKSKAACFGNIKTLVNYLQGNKEANMTWISNTLMFKRPHFKFRSAIVSSTVSEAIEKLNALTLTDINESCTIDKEDLAFYFAPQGIQYNNMLANSRNQHCPQFNQTSAELIEKASRIFCCDFEKIMYSTTELSNEIQSTCYGQVALFIICFSIFSQLKEWGINSSLFLGHSMGEYTAMACANCIDEDQMLRILKIRGDFFTQTPRAKMLAVRGDVTGYLPSDIEITSYLDDLFFCVAGPPDSIERLKTVLTTKSIDFKELTTEFGYHSYMLKDILSSFECQMKEFKFKEPNTLIVSNVDGEKIESITPGYLSHHMRSPVRLDKCIAMIEKFKKKCIVQIGPAGILEHLLMNSDIKVLRTAPPKKEATTSNLNLSLFCILCDLWKNGYEVDFGKVFNFKYWDPEVPSYQFERIECWEHKEKMVNNIQQWVWKQCKQVQRHDTREKLFVISNVSAINVDHVADFQSPEECLNCASSLSNRLSELGMTAAVYAPCILTEMDYNARYIYMYYFVTCLCNFLPSKTKIFVICEFMDSIGWICLGSLRERILSTREDNSYFVQSTSKNYPEIVNNVIHSKSDSNIFLVHNQTEVLTLSYGIVSQLSRMTFGEHILILGGGAIGMNIVRWLENSTVKRFSIWSRSAITNDNLNNLKDTLSSGGRSEILLRNVDICNIKDLRDSFRQNKHKINSIIYTAGISPVRKQQKSFEECRNILDSKVAGLSNLLTVLKEDGLIVENLLLMSSLSSVLSIQGISEYASANIFLDNIALRGHPNVERILSIQWPAWKSVGMYSDKETDLLEKGSISVREAQKLFFRCLTSEGCIAVAKKNPFALRNELVAHQIGKKLEVNFHNAKSSDELIRQVWQKALCVEVVQDNTDFFEAGGHSLSALQVVWEINDILSIDIKTSVLFDNPEFAQFLSKIKTSKQSEQILKIDKTQRLPLSFAQQNMYLLHKLEVGSNYNIVFRLSFFTCINENALKYSILRLIISQTGLRTVFLDDSFGTKQEVRSMTEHFYDLHYANSDAQASAQDCVSKWNMNFLLNECSLAIFIEKFKNSLRVVFSQHHIITDGWSMTILAENLKLFYQRYIEKSFKNDRILFSIPDFAVWQQKNTKLEQDIRAQVERLQPSIEFPTQISDGRKEREANFTNELPNFKTHSVAIPQQLIHVIRKFAKHFSTTEYVVMLSAFAVLLRQWKDDIQSDRVTIGSPISGRVIKEVGTLIGYFLNNMVVVLDIAPNETITDTIPKMIKHLSDIKHFEHVPFHKIIQKMKIPRSHNHPIFDVYFNFRNSLDFPKVQLGEASCEVDQLSINTAFDLSWTIDEMPNGYRLLIEYNSKYTNSLIQTMQKNYFKILKNTPEKEDKKRRHVRSVDFPLISSQFIVCEQKSLTPFYDALVGHQKVFSYRSLFKHVTTMASLLKRDYWKNKGFQPRNDDVIFVHHNMNDAVPLYLSIILCGAAYSPVDEHCSEEKVNLQQEAMPGSWKVKNSIGNRAVVVHKTLFNLNCTSDIVYVIHTSGSTGKPKIVPISHKNLVCFLEGATQSTFVRPSLRISHSVNTVFDVSKFNYWGAFVNGANLHTHTSLQNVPSEISDAKVDVAFLTSAVANSLPKNTLMKIGTNVELLIVGGESVSDKVLDALFQIHMNVLQIYGPSENTIWSLTNRCKILEQSGTLIGTPVNNEICHMKCGSAQMKCCRQSGEIVLSGPKMFRGYYNEMTCLEHQTGDFVVKYGDKYRFLGRRDRLIKIRGQRIDLQEVENAIRQLTNAMDVAVIKYNEQLVAFLVGVPDLQLKSIISNFESILKKAAIPSKFVAVNRIPHNASGKVDQKILLSMIPVINQQLVATQKMLNSLERITMQITQEILKADNLMLESDFFENGGHSLSALQFSQLLSEKLRFAVPVATIFQHSKMSHLVDHLKHSYVRGLKSTIEKTIVTSLREVKTPRYNVYAIHAIGGTIYPYYSLLQIFPDDVGIYAIEYNTTYSADNLTDLAHFYAQHVYCHCNNVRFVLLGHSMGGTLCREMVTELDFLGVKISFVVAIDTWCVEKGKLMLEDVENFVRNTFEAMPNREEMVDRSMKLAQMLRYHHYIKSDIKIILIKALTLGSSALKSAIRCDLTEDIVRSNFTNGLEALSTQAVEVLLAPGDHESVMKIENFNKIKKTLLELIDREFSTV